MSTDDVRRRFHEFLWNLTETVLHAPTQQEIDEQVCEGLHSREPIDVVWICGRSPDATPRTAVGQELGDVERIHAIINEQDGEVPWERATTEREGVVQSVSENWQGDSQTFGWVPLHHRGINHGVLAVGTASWSAAQLQTVIDVLTNFGQIVGHAMATIEMQAQSETFQGAIEEAEPAIAILNQDGTVEYVNSAFSSVYGYAKSEAVGSALEQFLPDDVDPTALLADVQDDTAWRQEIRHRRRSGERFYVDLSIAPVLVEGGTRWKYVAVASDITSLKEREQRLQVLNRVLRHNLRNSLVVLRGHVETAADRADESIAPLLSTALESADDLLATAATARKIQSVLEETAHREQDFAAVIERVAARARREFPDVTVTATTPDSTPVTAPSPLEDALWELLQNACKHGSDPVEITGDVDGGQPLVEITDEGPGIPEYELSVIRRGEETALEHGSGLGLWFAHWVFEGAGGELTFETDGGTTVRAILPPGSD